MLNFHQKKKKNYYYTPFKEINWWGFAQSFCLGIDGVLFFFIIFKKISLFLLFFDSVGILIFHNTERQNLRGYGR